jgi:hypothetical protein
LEKSSAKKLDASSIAKGIKFFAELFLKKLVFARAFFEKAQPR